VRVPIIAVDHALALGFVLGVAASCFYFDRRAAALVLFFVAAAHAAWLARRGPLR